METMHSSSQSQFAALTLRCQAMEQQIAFITSCLGDMNFDGMSQNAQKIAELESSLKQPIVLMNNNDFPFFDTSISNKVDFVNSVSLLNIQSISDFQKKIEKEVEPSIFRGNICVDGIEPWKEREWIGKIIKINNVSFKVEKNIPRCVAINLKPQTDDNSFNLLQSLKKTYNHFEMGIYLTVLDDGKINIGDTINI